MRARLISGVLLIALFRIHLFIMLALVETHNDIAVVAGFMLTTVFCYYKRAYIYLSTLCRKLF